jgi:hypothetical protein
MTDPEKSVTHVSIPLDLLNAVLAYLVRRPFVEVSDFVLRLKAHGDASFIAQSGATPPSASGDQPVGS